MLRDKTPAAEKDYSFDWTAWLAGDSIASHAVTVDGELRLLSDERTGNVVTAFVGGGIVGQFSLVHCEITTADGRTESRAITLRIVSVMPE